MYVRKLFAKRFNFFKVNISVQGRSIKEILDELYVLISHQFNLHGNVINTKRPKTTKRYDNHHSFVFNLWKQLFLLNITHFYY